MRRTLLAATGGVGSALLGALCCVGPLMFVTFGVGAGLATTFEPIRPLFGVLMLGAFGIAFYTVYGRRSAPVDACAPGDPCARPRNRRREEAILWTAAVIALLLWLWAGAFATSRAVAPTGGAPVIAPRWEMQTVRLRVEGMTCGGCAISARVVLQRLDGVHMAEVSYRDQLAVVTYDGEKVTPERMIEALKQKLRYVATVVDPASAA